MIIFLQVLALFSPTTYAAPPILRENIGAWTLKCLEAECKVAQSASASDNSAEWIRVAFFNRHGVTHFEITTSPLPENHIQIAIDGEPVRNIVDGECDDRQCRFGEELTPERRSLFLKGSNLHTRMRSGPSELLSFTFALTGLGEALAHLPDER